MSDEIRVPYKNFGDRLKRLREGRRESVAEVSGAVEIPEVELQKFEAGVARPTEDILMLLFSHFNLDDAPADELWKLAGYEDRTSSDDDQDVPPHIVSPHQAMMVMMDPRIMYSDGVEAVAGNRGVVLTFSQMNNVMGQNQSQPLVISRIGMSREQAQQVMGVLHQVLYDLDNPDKRRLDSGNTKPKQ